jgi:hypothetical protein
MEAVRTLVQEYVFMAQKMQQPHPCDACCGSERGDNDDGEDAVVDQDTTGVAGTRLVLSINFVASYNAKAIACQQVEMERPVAVTRRNQRLLQGISRRVDDCLSCLKGQPSYHDDVEVSSAALVRALEWFKDSSFTVSVIAPSDSIPLRQVPSLASALTKLREVQFVLLRSDDERAVQSSQNILRLLRAIKRSENPMCGIRQIDNYALQLHGLTVCGLDCACGCLKDVDLKGLGIAEGVDIPSGSKCLSKRLLRWTSAKQGQPCSASY